MNVSSAIVGYIASFLNYIDYLSFSLTCTSVSCACNSTNTLTALSIHNAYYQYNNINMRMFRNIRQISLRINYCHQFITKTLSPKLKELILYGSWDNNVSCNKQWSNQISINNFNSNQFINYHQIDTLRLIGFYSFDSKIIINNILYKICKTIQYIDIVRTHIEWHSVPQILINRSIKGLSFEHYDTEDIIYINNIITNSIQTLQWLYFVDHKDLFTSFSTSNQFINLQFLGLCYITNQSLDILSQYVTNIEGLLIINHSHLVEFDKFNHNIYNFLKCCNKLKYIEIKSFCNSDVLHAFIKSFNKYVIDIHPQTIYISFLITQQEQHLKLYCKNQLESIIDNLVNYSQSFVVRIKYLYTEADNNRVLQYISNKNIQHWSTTIPTYQFHLILQSNRKIISNCIIFY